METVMTAQQIYQELYAVCPPYMLPGPWAGLKGDPAVRAVPPDLATWLEQVSKKFAAADLIAAGVAEADNNGGLKLSTRLEGPGKPLVFLYAGSGDGPSAVLTSQGMLGGRRFPVTAAFSDVATRRALSSAQELLLAFSLEDVAVLRAVGLPATFAFGMDRLSSSRTAMFRLCENCSWESSSPWLFPPSGPQPPPKLPRPGEPCTSYSPDHSEPHKSLPLILVGWSVAELRRVEPTQLKPVMAQLDQVEKHLDIKNMDIGIWNPSPTSWERLGFHLKHRCYEGAAADMHEDLAENCWDPPSGEPAPPVDLVTALTHYRKALGDSKRRNGSSEDVHRAQETFHERLEQELLLPLRSTAGGSPEARNSQALLVGVSGLAHRLMPSIEAELVDQDADTFMRGPLPKLKELERLVRMVIALTKQCQRTEPRTGKRRPRTPCRAGRTLDSGSLIINGPALAQGAQACSGPPRLSNLQPMQPTRSAVAALTFVLPGAAQARSPGRDPTQ
jgi:hypothetical protein